MKKQILMVLILVLAAVLPAAAQEDEGGLVNAGGDEETTYLVGPDGMTLYIFTNDEPGVSNCEGDCLANWPALTAPSLDEITAGEGVNEARLGGIETEDGTYHVTYDDMPLYYFVNDTEVGDITGHEAGDVWFIVEVVPFSLDIGSNEEFGSYLVGPNGMAVYIFTNDADGASNCEGDCLANWPALTVESEDALTVNPNLLGEVSLLEREDTGELQIVYNDMPLYYFVNDTEVGDITGHEAGDVWYLYPPEIIGVGGNDDLGDFLVGPNGLTLYVFSNDEAGVSNCTGDCLVNWPPLLASSADTLIGTPAIDSSLIGSIPYAEDDSQVIVTYEGFPLYYFINDEVPGEATGHEAGDVWFVVPVE